MRLTIEASHEQLALAREFRISRGAKTHADVVVVKVSDGTHTGWGEAVPYARYDETLEGTLASLNRIGQSIACVDDHVRLNATLPAGAARNALDCALWDLRAQQQQQPVAQLTGLTEPASCVTAQTISVGTLAGMQEDARVLAGAELLKIKLDPEDVVDKIAAIHAVIPTSRFIVDANEGWSLDLLKQVAPQLARLNVALIEQPLPAGEDDALADYQCPVPLCADESCHTTASLSALVGRYQAINIKLDKTGGLTEAMSLLRAARHHQLDIMVGCMVASSLAMAPAYLLTEHASFVDLDGPVLVKQDRPNGFTIENGILRRPSNLLWGTGQPR